MSLFRTAVVGLSLVFAMNASAQSDKKDCDCPDIAKEVDMKAAAFGEDAFKAEFPDEKGVNTSVVSGDRNEVIEGIKGKKERQAAASALDEKREEESFRGAQQRFDSFFTR